MDLYNEPIWTPGMSLEQMEKLVILAELRFHRGNKTATSQTLGISIRTLDAKLEKYDQEGKTKDELIRREQEKRERFLERARGVVARMEEKIQTLHEETSSGVRVQSTQNSTSQPPVPVSERQEVQSVSFEASSRNHPRKAR